VTARPPSALVLPAGISARSAQAWGRDRLQSTGIEEGGLEAGLLLGHVLGLDRTGLLLHGPPVLSASETAEFQALIARRLRREPVAYLVGTRDWLDLRLSVDRNVLAPRQETEILAGLAVEATGWMAATRDHAPRVADVGTGSGALAIAIARACPAAGVLAIDSGVGALRTARENCLRLAPNRVEIVEGNLMPAHRPVDVLVANLPYIPTGELAGLEPELSYEPRLALDGGPDGLRLIEPLLYQAREALAPGGVMLLECHHDQGARIREMALAQLPGSAVSLHPDLAGIPRFVRVEAAPADVR